MKTKFISTTPVKVKINQRQLKKEVFGDGERVVATQLRPIIQQRIYDAQEQMVEDFEDHPVTQEIEAGNSAENSSGLLGGYGNLFSFIGFDEGSDPIGPLAQIFRRKIPFSVRGINGLGKFNVTIQAPSKQEIYDVGQVDWMGGRSWLDGIEKGIAGLNRYLYDEDYGFDNSRSGTGIQVKKEVRGVTQGRAPYVSKILNDFKQRLTRLI